MIDPLLIPIIGMAIPIVIVPTSLHYRHARHLRGLEHAERMKALAMGRSLPQDEPWWSPARMCLAIAAGVPAGVFFCAWMASESLDFHEEIWLSAGIVGLSGVVSGSILAHRHLAAREWVRDEAPWGSKPGVEADAFDVVSRRG
jgi:hypothetical protein